MCPRQPQGIDYRTINKDISANEKPQGYGEEKTTGNEGRSRERK